MPRNQHRGFCFTVNNYSDEDIAAVAALYEEDELCTYLIIGYETAPRTGTKHLQCYAYYPNGRTFNHLKSVLPPQTHIEAQKSSSNVKAYVYCKEDGDYTEFGQEPRQGHRSDLENIKYKIIEGKDDKYLAMNYFSQYCQYGKRFQEARKLFAPRYETKLIYVNRSNLNRKYIRHINQNYEKPFIFEDSIDKFELFKTVESGEYSHVFHFSGPLMIDEHPNDYDDMLQLELD